MKITSGSAKHRRLAFQETPGLRPTKERIRQALFDVLFHRFGVDLTQASVLEGFGGTGILSFEAISRGAKQVYCIEKNPVTARLIQTHARQLSMEGALRVICSDLLQFRSFQTDRSFDLVFLDPPYNEDLVLPAVRHLRQEGLLANEALIVVECRKRDLEAMAQSLAALSSTREGSFSLQACKTYGKIALGFFQEKI